MNTRGRSKTALPSLTEVSNDYLVSFKKTINSLSDINKEKAISIMKKINPNGLVEDSISFQQFNAICNQLGLFNIHTLTFVTNSTIVYDYKNQLRFLSSLDSQYDEVDILKQMCEDGYGLEANKNSKLMFTKKENIALRRVSPDLWQWLQMMKEDQISILQQNKGVPSSPNELNNIQDILSRGQNYFTNKERTQCLRILKWVALPLNANGSDANQHLLNSHLASLSEMQLFRASAVAAFHFEFEKAFDLLNKVQPEEDQVYAVKLLKSALSSLKLMQAIVKDDSTLKSRFENTNQMTKEFPEQDITFDDITRAKQSNFLQFEQVQGTTQQSLAIEKDLSVSFKNIQNQSLRYHLVEVQFNFVCTLLRDTNFNHPYLDALARFLSLDFVTENNVHKQVWQMEELEVFDRIALALRFADDDTLNIFIKEMIKKAISEPCLESLVLVGKDERAIEIIQTFVDQKRDVQTAGLVSAYLLVLGYSGKEELKKWYKNYKNLLNNQGMFERRHILDKEFRSLCNQLKVDIDQGNEGANKQKIAIDSKQLCAQCKYFNSQFRAIMKQKHANSQNGNPSSASHLPTVSPSLQSINCSNIQLSPNLISSTPSTIYSNNNNSNSNNNNNNNNNIINNFRLSSNPSNNFNSSNAMQNFNSLESNNGMFNITLYPQFLGGCSNCVQDLPTCSVCLLSCELLNPYTILPSKMRYPSGQSVEHLNLEDGILWCQSCRHGGHYKHLQEWFTEYEICAVNGCSCKCSIN